MSVIFSLSSIKGHLHKEAVSPWFYVGRKGAHITEYFILAILLLRLFYYKKVEKVEAIVLTIVFATLWAFSDEIHQIFVFGREGKISDVGIDFVGIFLGILLVRRFYKLSKK